MQQKIWLDEPGVTGFLQGYSGIKHQAAIETSTKTLPEETIFQLCYHNL
jgi:hypothetical protein